MLRKCETRLVLRVFKAQEVSLRFIGAALWKKQATRAARTDVGVVLHLVIPERVLVAIAPQIAYRFAQNVRVGAIRLKIHQRNQTVIIYMILVSLKSQRLFLVVAIRL